MTVGRRRSSRRSTTADLVGSAPPCLSHRRLILTAAPLAGPARPSPGVAVTLTTTPAHGGRPSSISLRSTAADRHRPIRGPFHHPSVPCGDEPTTLHGHGPPTTRRPPGPWPRTVVAAHAGATRGAPADAPPYPPNPPRPASAVHLAAAGSPTLDDGRARGVPRPGRHRRRRLWQRHGDATRVIVDHRRHLEHPGASDGGPDQHHVDHGSTERRRGRGPRRDRPLLERLVRGHGEPARPEQRRAQRCTDAATREARIIGGIQEWRDAGKYVRIPSGSIYERRVISVTFSDEGIATALQCIVDDTELVDANTGSVVDSELATLKLTTTLSKDADGWRITTTSRTERIDGRAACDD